MLEYDDLDDVAPPSNVRSRRVRVPGSDPLIEVLDRLEKTHREEVAEIVRREIAQPLKVPKNK